MNGHRTLAYLGQPYTHQDQAVRNYRFEKGCITAAFLMAKGHHVFAPILQGHSVSEHLLEWGDSHEFWMEHSAAWFSRCDFLLVLPLAGWEESKGLATEMGWAQAQNKPIFQLTGQIPSIPKWALEPSPSLNSIVCDQFGPRAFPRFSPEQSHV